MMISKQKRMIAAVLIAVLIPSYAYAEDMFTSEDVIEVTTEPVLQEETAEPVVYETEYTEPVTEPVIQEPVTEPPTEPTEYVDPPQNTDPGETELDWIQETDETELVWIPSSEADEEILFSSGNDSFGREGVQQEETQQEVTQSPTDGSELFQDGSQPIQDQTLVDILSQDANQAQPEATQPVLQSNPVMITQNTTNLHAGNGFYINSLKDMYGISFSEDAAQILAEIELDYYRNCGLLRGDYSVIGETTDPDYGHYLMWDANYISAYALSLTDGRFISEGLLVRNWQDILAIYLYEKIKSGVAELTVDASSKSELYRILTEMDPLLTYGTELRFGCRHINWYIRQHNLSEEDRSILQAYTETDCKLLCATITAFRGFIRQSAGETVPEDRIDVVSAALSLVGQVGYVWGGKSVTIGKEPGWSTGASGLDCSGFVTWAIVNGYCNPEAEGFIGHGTEEQWTHTYVVNESECMTGDLVFQRPGEVGSDNHIGILIGKTDAGDWIAVHCTSGKNGVVVGEAYSAGFRYIRRPNFFLPELELKIYDISSLDNPDPSIVVVEGEESTAVDLLDSFNPDFLDVVAFEDNTNGQTEDGSPLDDSSLDEAPVVIIEEAS